MKARFPTTIVLVLAGLASVGRAADEPSRFLIREPAAEQRIDYLIVTADKFIGDLDVLAEHRTKEGRTVGIVMMSAVKAGFPSLRDFLAHAVTKWKKPAPAFLLLVGDTDEVPTIVKPGKFSGWMSDRDIATDFDYARPTGAQPLLHVGRFPCDTADDLAAMIRKTIAYETTVPGGAWQRKLHLIASVGGFGEKIDTMLENMAMGIASGAVPPAFDIEAAYGSPASPFCPYPPKFNEHVMAMFNGGPLLSLFLGHGDVSGVADIRWKGKSYPIFRADDAKSLAPKDGIPILVVIACHTGRIDRDDCLGEVFLKAAKAPVAFIGGSRVTQPYANAVFAKAFIDAFFGDARTLGEVLTRAKRTVSANPFSMFRVQVDTVGATMMGKESLEPMRADVVEHYNLLGDPALVIRRPKADIAVEVAVAAGKAIARIRAPGRNKAELSLECDRSVFLGPLPEADPDAPDFEKQVTERYRKAIDKVMRRWTLELRGGVGEVEFALPEKEGRYFVKAHAGESIGAAVLIVAPPEQPPTR